MKNKAPNSIRLLVAGICFAILWSSASAATKIGLESAQPFVIAVTRFFIAGFIMLFLSHAILKNRLPQRNEWKQLAVYGLLNISIYLGLYVIAMQQISAGLGSLSTGTNPVFISVIGALWFKEKMHRSTIFSLILCMAGVVIAAYPLLINSYATPAGLVILIISMVSYSVAALYFSNNKWNNLHILTINGWQTLIGGVFLVPFLFIFYDKSKNIYDIKWMGSVLWLAIPVSIGAVQLWLYLLKDNPVKAAFWLFLCPVFGFIIAAIVLKEPISVYTLTGVLFVIAGLYIVQKRKAV
ncbi:MAG TPA: EamA family transporter [Panacibacter sp.]|nr:EamA family transporter [Panacibacter sp.]